MNSARLFALFSLAMIALLLGMPVMAFAQVEEVAYKNGIYYVYRVNTASSNLEFYGRQPNGKPIATFDNLQKKLAAQGKQMTFATNGGIYTPALNPLGLYIENGQLLTPINNRNGNGNYYLKPNAVFYLTSDKQAGIVTSEKYGVATVGKKISHAMQSGPQLLIDGQIHPSFQAQSDNMNVRSGVGIINDNEVVFAISANEVNFYDFASFFKEMYQCKNALYLDGTISNMYWYSDKDKNAFVSHNSNNAFAVMIADSRSAKAGVINNDGKGSEIPPIDTNPVTNDILDEAFFMENGLAISAFSPQEYQIKFNYLTDILTAEGTSEFFWSLYGKAANKSAIKSLYTGGYHIPQTVLCLFNGVPSLFSSKEYDETLPKSDANLPTGPFLLENGSLSAFASSSVAVAQYYSGIGIATDGKVVIIASDGIADPDPNSIKKNAGRKITIKELALEFQKRGCKDAVLLAPEGSAKSCIPGKKNNFNASIDEQKVTTILTIIKK